MKADVEGGGGRIDSSALATTKLAKQFFRKRPPTFGKIKEEEEEIEKNFYMGCFYSSLQYYIDDDRLTELSEIFKTYIDIIKNRYKNTGTISELLAYVSQDTQFLLKAFGQEWLKENFEIKNLGNYLNQVSPDQWKFFINYVFSGWDSIRSQLTENPALVADIFKQLSEDNIKKFLKCLGRNWLRTFYDEINTLCELIRSFSSEYIGLYVSGKAVKILFFLNGNDHWIQNKISNPHKLDAALFALVCGETSFKTFYHGQINSIWNLFLSFCHPDNHKIIFSTAKFDSLLDYFYLRGGLGWNYFKSFRETEIFDPAIEARYFKIEIFLQLINLISQIRVASSEQSAILQECFNMFESMNRNNGKEFYDLVRADQTIREAVNHLEECKSYLHERCMVLCLAYNHELQLPVTYSFKDLYGVFAKSPAILKEKTNQVIDCIKRSEDIPKEYAAVSLELQRIHAVYTQKISIQPANAARLEYKVAHAHSPSG